MKQKILLPAFALLALSLGANMFAASRTGSLCKWVKTRKSGAFLFLWMRAGGGSPPEFLSTHPSPSSRIKDLSSKAPDYMGIYESVSDKPQCG